MNHRKLWLPSELGHRLQGSLISNKQSVNVQWAVTAGLLHQFMGTDIVGQVPLFYTARLITGNQLSLVRVDDNIVH